MSAVLSEGICLASCQNANLKCQSAEVHLKHREAEKASPGQPHGGATTRIRCCAVWCTKDSGHNSTIELWVERMLKRAVCSLGQLARNYT